MRVLTGAVTPAMQVLSHPSEDAVTPTVRVLTCHTSSEDAVTPSVRVLTGAISICSAGAVTLSLQLPAVQVSQPSLQMLTARALWV